MKSKQKTAYTEIREYKIYIIIHEKTLQFFTGTTYSTDMTSLYSKHYSLQNQQTRELFKEFRETIYCPQFYILQTLECTLAEARAREISFIRYFRENGYTCLNKNFIVEWSDDLTEYAGAFFKDIEQDPIEKHLSKSKHILLNYGRRRSDKNKNKYDEGKKQICFRVSEEEYAAIKAQADKNDKTLTAYAKEVALLGKVMHIDYDGIREFTKEMNQYKQLTNAIIKLFISTGEIYDSDIERLYDLAKSTDDSAKKLLHEFLKHTENVRSIIKNELQVSQLSH